MRYLLSVAAFLLMAGISEAQSAHQVTLKWWTTGANTYNVYKLKGVCPTPVVLSAFTKIAVITPISYDYSYVDTGVTEGITYCYILTAVSGTTESGWSGAWQATIPVFK